MTFEFDLDKNQKMMSAYFTQFCILIILIIKYINDMYFVTLLIEKK